jgi:hypothetical protein
VGGCELVVQDVDHALYVGKGIREQNEIVRPALPPNDTGPLQMQAQVLVPPTSDSSTNNLVESLLPHPWSFRPPLLAAARVRQGGEGVPLEMQAEFSKAQLPEEAQAEAIRATRLRQTAGNDVVRQNVECTVHIELTQEDGLSPTGALLESEPAGL